MDHNTPQQHTSVSLPQPVVDGGEPSSKVAPAETGSQAPAQLVVPPPTPSSSVAPVAQDSDLIESGWVTQVDSLVKQMVADPRQLSQEFAKLKAQYIAGRYGKEIKQTDEKG